MYSRASHTFGTFNYGKHFNPLHSIVTPVHYFYPLLPQILLYNYRFIRYRVTGLITPMPQRSYMEHSSHPRAAFSLLASAQDTSEFPLTCTSYPRAPVLLTCTSHPRVPIPPPPPNLQKIEMCIDVLQKFISLVAFSHVGAYLKNFRVSLLF